MRNESVGGRKFGRMSVAEIRRRWPSIDVTDEERKRQIDEIGLDDFADTIAENTQRYLNADERGRRLLAGTDLAYADQERVNAALGIN